MIIYNNNMYEIPVFNGSLNTSGYFNGVLVWPKLYYVTILDSINGVVNASPMQGVRGTNIQLSNTPAANHRLTHYVVNDNIVQADSFSLQSDSSVYGVFTELQQNQYYFDDDWETQPVVDRNNVDVCQRTYQQKGIQS